MPKGSLYRMTYLRAGKPRGCTFAARTDSAALSFAEKWAAGLGAVLLTLKLLRPLKEAT